ncbi:antibiotic biosynthesis monooxygenase [Nocardiopsis sp. CNR-923]|uniref:antibiotic biosynthesis monooxygenase family protein n=1 Tax=Nocardiopsis sp. CNR-923 TaxID=1904965 RepID=UPI00095D7B74|nr:antibiotic biosynthesis monooxygenase [Nocardiopsis sp. CNR-923]OLT29399.1 antibiotic biosynthesis monooxygenase [Nocardiopsis sp. CNR-923]
MSVVKFNVLTVPEGSGATLEERFAKRAGLVENQPGFEEFQLLRPVEGTDRYLVYTRWRAEEDFQNWVNSQDFRHGHAQAARESGRTGHGHGGEGAAAPAATGSELWGFEVVQRVCGP